MRNVPRKGFITAVTLTIATLAFSVPLGAQQGGPGPGGGQNWWRGESRMMGPGMMGRGDWDRACGPAAMGFAQWRIDQLERQIKLTDDQRQKLDELKAASTKAAEAMRSACPGSAPATMPERLQAMENRLEVMLQGIKLVRPAADAFYASLSNEQKARIEENQAHGRFWRWMHSW